ncbi:MAG: PA domain-containing protein, partial [Mycobacterium sp.]
MDHKSKPMLAVLGVVLVAAFLTGGCTCSSHTSEPQGAPAAAGFAATLRDQVTAEAMMTHLQKLQDIANANGGTRALGTPGYDASLDYVVNTLRDHGFDVQTPEFSARVFRGDKGSVSLEGKTLEARALQFSLGTPPDGVSGPLVVAPADDSPGCTASDYDGLPVQRAVVLVNRGTCPFKEKEAAAVERGAAALVVADNVDEEKMGGTLGEQTDVKIPVVSVKKSDGAVLRGMQGMATVKLDAHTDNIASRNVIAQTETGSTDSVVMLGAHLDSVPEGPGIND